MMYEQEWTESVVLQLHTDACGYAYGAVFGTRCISTLFDDDMLKNLIACKELYAVVSACATWGGFFTSKKLILFCDNSSVVDCVNMVNLNARR